MTSNEARKLLRKAWRTRVARAQRNLSSCGFVAKRHEVGRWWPLRFAGLTFSLTQLCDIVMRYTSTSVHFPAEKTPPTSSHSVDRRGLSVGLLRRLWGGCVSKLSSVELGVRAGVNLPREIFWVLRPSKLHLKLQVD